MCRRWRDDYGAFLADLGPAPSPHHSVERKDNNGPYSPDNCYWATPSEQARNRRNSVRIRFNGSERLLCEVAEEHGLNYHTLYNAVLVRKVAAEVAIARFTSGLSSTGRSRGRLKHLRPSRG